MERRLQCCLRICIPDMLIWILILFLILWGSVGFGSCYWLWCESVSSFLTLMRFRTQLFTMMRIRIRLPQWCGSRFATLYSPVSEGFGSHYIGFFIRWHVQIVQSMTSKGGQSANKFLKSQSCRPNIFCDLQTENRKSANTSFLLTNIAYNALFQICAK